MKQRNTTGLPAALAVLAITSLSAASQTPADGCTAAPPALGTAALVIEDAKIFTYFMLMLGPVKLLVPFARMTASLNEPDAHNLALRGVGIACFAGLATAYAGQRILEKWGVSLPALMVATGLVLLLVALQSVLAQYSAPGPDRVVEKQRTAPGAYKKLAFTPLAFPIIVTPYGAAILVLLLAETEDPWRTLEIIGVFFAVMLLNLLAMWFVRPILKYGAGMLSLLGAVLGVLQIALAIQMLVLAGRMLGVLPAPRT